MRLSQLHLSGSSEQLLNGTHLRWIGLGLKSVISIAAILYIYYRVSVAESELALLGYLQQLQWKGNAAWLAGASFVVVLLNWGSEVVKWKWLVSHRYPITWKLAVKGVLSGITFGLFTPNRMGEFFGRVLTLQMGKRVEGAFLSMVNGIAQTVATFSFGIVGFVVLLATLGVAGIGVIPTMILQVTLMLTLLLVVLLYFRLDAWAYLLGRIRFVRRFTPQIEAVSMLPASMLTRLYTLSLFRFCTFVMQYVIVFYALMPEQPLVQVISASIMTLFSITLLPFIPIPDILLRESFALGYFDLYHFDPIGVSVAVFLVWLINVAGPSLFGAATLFTYRFFRPR